MTHATGSREGLVEPEYRPWDQRKHLGDPPWRPDDPAVREWERVHGHDVRLKCYAEFGCQVIEDEAFWLGYQRGKREGVDLAALADDEAAVEAVAQAAVTNAVRRLPRLAGDWRVSVGDQPGPLFAEVLAAQHVWYALNRRQRSALRDLEVAHPLTRRALERHGLVDDEGTLTDAGRIVIKWAPEREAT